ncbi:MAG TPA: FAD:protein FMN transferase [Thermoanaerobaculia bacterium]|nr:FAD:protein FMN transferase [Thermoanaerobaculia bacterium]
MRRSRVLILVALYGALAAGLALRQHDTATAAATAGEPAARYATFRGEAMYTTVQVTLPAGPQAEAAAGEVLDLFRRLEGDLSEWRAGSPLAALNEAAGGAAVPVPPDLLALLGRGRALGELTGGAFDVTWAALWGLWDFRATSPVVPPRQAVARQAALVDYRRLELDPAAGSARLPVPGMKVGLGGIAKGYALDRAAELLDGRGLDSWLLVAGGQVLARGSRAGRPWTVGIRDPRGAADELLAPVVVGDLSLSTSGDYESFFERDGVRYHHVLDPRTGWPARGVRSATVVAAEATLADALSTAMLALGPEAGLRLARRAAVEAVLVDAAGRVAVTPGLADRLRLHRPPS